MVHILPSIISISKLDRSGDVTSWGMLINAGTLAHCYLAKNVSTSYLSFTSLKWLLLLIYQYTFAPLHRHADVRT
ncbi:hypothetical protein BS78_08G117900 [Paspalum vaginatum]|nr:hypothetical protein BS78_08G117900 [Paspalum vaginatum]